MISIAAFERVKYCRYNVSRNKTNEYNALKSFPRTDDETFVAQ